LRFVKLSPLLHYASNHLDIEWLLSTLFDASLLSLEPPATAALFLGIVMVVPFFRQIIGLETIS